MNSNIHIALRVDGRSGSATGSPRPSMTASPGSISRTNSAPTVSSAQVSEVMMAPPSGKRPRQRGRIPRGSRTPTSASLVRNRRQYAPCNRGSARRKTDTMSVPIVCATSSARTSVMLEVVTQQLRVREVAIVGDGDASELRMLDDDGLGVLEPVRSGRRVARVTEREVPSETLQCVGVEGLRHQAHVLVHAQDMTVAGRNPGALLPAVLQGIKAEIGQVGNVLAAGVDAEQTAGFVHPLVGHQMTPQTAVSQDCPRVSNEMRMSDPTWKSSPPTTPIACSGT